MNFRSFRCVFRYVSRHCVFEWGLLLQSAACQNTMVFTMDSDDFQVSRFSGKWQKNMKFRLEFRCQKRRKFSAEFPWKSDAQNMKIHENLLKLTPESRPSKKNAQKWDFWWILATFGGPWGPQNGQKWWKRGFKEACKKQWQNEDRKSCASQVEKAMFLSKHLISTTL